MGDETVSEGKQSTRRTVDTLTILALGGTLFLVLLALLPSGASPDQRGASGGPLAVTKLLVGAFLVVVILLRFRSGGDIVMKEVVISICDVAEERVERYAATLQQAMGTMGKTKFVSRDSEMIALHLWTDRPLQEIVDRANRLGLKTELAGVRCEVQYNSISAKAEMTVEIRGRAAPNSTITVEGLSGALPVDKTGKFVVRLPIRMLQQFAGRGHIPAVCRKGALSEEIRIPLPK